MVSEKLIDVFTKMDANKWMTLCETVMLVPFFIFDKSYRQTHERIVKRKITDDPVFYSSLQNEPTLFCSLEDSWFYLAKFLNYEGYIMYSTEGHERNDVVGVVTEPYKYELQIDREIKTTISNIRLWTSKYLLLLLIIKFMLVFLFLMSFVWGNTI